MLDEDERLLEALIDINSLWDEGVEVRIGV
jgi:hypothetical protein